MGFNTVITETLSQHLQKVSANPSTAIDWQVGVFQPVPEAGGVHRKSASENQLGMVAPNRIFIQPFCDGPPGSQFAMRLWGWRGYGPTDGDGPRELDVPFFIAEWICTSCNCPGPQSEGPPGFPSIRPMQPSENLCDTIVLVQGDLGASGWINATGAPATVSAPAVPTNLPGYTTVELQGAKQFQFDFKQIDSNIGMNAFYCKLS